MVINNITGRKSICVVLFRIPVNRIQSQPQTLNYFVQAGEIILVKSSKLKEWRTVGFQRVFSRLVPAFCVFLTFVLLVRILSLRPSACYERGDFSYFKPGGQAEPDQARPFLIPALNRLLLRLVGSLGAITALVTTRFSLCYFSNSRLFRICTVLESAAKLFECGTAFKRIETSLRWLRVNNLTSITFTLFGSVTTNLRYLNILLVYAYVLTVKCSILLDYVSFTMKIDNPEQLLCL